MLTEGNRRAGDDSGFCRFLLLAIALGFASGCAPKPIEGQASIIAGGHTIPLASVRIAFVPTDRIERYKAARAQEIRDLQDGAANLAHANGLVLARESHRLDELHDLKAKKSARIAALVQKTADDRKQISTLKSHVAQLDATRKAWNDKATVLNNGVAESHVPPIVQARRNAERRQIQKDVEQADKELVDVQVLEENIAANDYVIKTLRAESADVDKAEQKLQAATDEYAASTASAQAKVQAYIDDSFSDFIPGTTVAESDAEGRFSLPPPPAEHSVFFAEVTVPAAAGRRHYVWLLDADHLSTPLQLTNENLYRPADLLIPPTHS